MEDDISPNDSISQVGAWRQGVARESRRRPESELGFTAVVRESRRAYINVRRPEFVRESRRRPELVFTAMERSRLLSQVLAVTSPDERLILLADTILQAQHESFADSAIVAEMVEVLQSAEFTVAEALFILSQAYTIVDNSRMAQR